MPDQGRYDTASLLSAEFRLKCKAFALPYTRGVLVYTSRIRDKVSNAAVGKNNHPAALLTFSGCRVTLV